MEKKTVLLVDTSDGKLPPAAGDLGKTSFWTGDTVPFPGDEIVTVWGPRVVTQRRYDSRISTAPWTLAVKMP
jgi:hypothetical protein